MNHGTCKHFGSRPGGHLVCEKGHDIRKLVGGEEYGWMRRVPCHDPDARVGTSLPMLDPVTCADYEDPTAEEVADYEMEVERIMAAFAKGLCPKCGGALTVRGHSHVCDACKEVVAIS